MKIFRALRTPLRAFSFESNGSDQARVYMKPLMFDGPDMALCVHSQRATIQNKGRGILTIGKFGSIIFDFVPTTNVDGRTSFNYKSKKVYILDANNAIDIITNNTTGNTKAFNYSFTYSNNTKSMSLVRREGESNVTVSFYEQGSPIQNTIEITAKDWFLINRMADYTLPFMMGWDVLKTPVYAKETQEYF